MADADGLDTGKYLLPADALKWLVQTASELRRECSNAAAHGDGDFAMLLLELHGKMQHVIVRAETRHAQKERAAQAEKKRRELEALQRRGGDDGDERP